MAADARIQLTDGTPTPESWVYVWRRPGGDVLYIGATGLPLAARTWLHLHDPRPEIGRVAAEAPAALLGEVEVLGFAVADGLDRRQVRSALQAVVDQQARPADIDDRAWAEATRIAAELT